MFAGIYCLYNYSASWFNQVENRFSTLADKALKNDSSTGMCGFDT
jgi:hypothetical protein